MDDDATYMLSEHVKAKSLQDLQVIYHSLPVWRSVYTVRPKSLIQSSEQENKFAVQERPGNSINAAFGNSSESSIASNCILTHCDGEVVQIG